jgi:hypothetical protein
MQSTAKVLKVIGFVLIVVVIGLFVGWLATREKTRPPETSKGLAKTVAKKPDEATFAVHRTIEVTNDMGESTNEWPYGEGNYSWEDKIGDILGADNEIEDKVKELFELYPKLSDEGKKEAVEHLSNLIADDDQYGPLGKLLVDTNTPAGASESLLNDLINRENKLRVPLMLEVARNPNHSQAAEAKDMLMRILEDDYGDDWKLWEEKAKEWVKENPD